MRSTRRATSPPTRRATTRVCNCTRAGPRWWGSASTAGTGGRWPRTARNRRRYHLSEEFRNGDSIRGEGGKGYSGNACLEASSLGWKGTHDGDAEGDPAEARARERRIARVPTCPQPGPSVGHGAGERPAQGPAGPAAPPGVRAGDEQRPSQRRGSGRARSDRGGTERLHHPRRRSGQRPRVRSAWPEARPSRPPGRRVRSRSVGDREVRPDDRVVRARRRLTIIIWIMGVVIRRASIVVLAGIMLLSCSGAATNVPAPTGPPEAGACSVGRRPFEAVRPDVEQAH